MISESKALPRILFLTSDLALGGGAVFILNVCAALRQSRIWEPVAGVFSGVGTVGRQLIDSGYRVIGPFPKAAIHEEFIEAMFAECRLLAPAVVVANLGGDTFDFLRFVPDSVIRVAMIHSDDENVYAQVERYLPWIDLVVGVSSHNRDVMRKRLGKRAVPVEQVACGVPMPETPPREIRRHGPLRVLYLGRVVEAQKRASLMIKVIRQSFDTGLDVTWTIAGDGPELARVQEAFTEESERVGFLGEVAYAEVPPLLAEHDVYFLCSDFEGLPLSMLEAMGAGCVPVVSDLPSGISEVVDDRNGIRVPFSGMDESAYVGALAELCADRVRLAEMAAAAARTVRENYSNAAMAERWTRLLATHAKPMAPDWNKPCIADAPPECRTQWRFHPRLRWLRKLGKLAGR
jgi:glycosyltransferase involved in cell wall biosynthesis